MRIRNVELSLVGHALQLYASDFAIQLDGARRAILVKLQRRFQVGRDQVRDNPQVDIRLFASGPADLDDIVTASKGMVRLDAGRLLTVCHRAGDLDGAQRVFHLHLAALDLHDLSIRFALVDVHAVLELVDDDQDV